MVQQPATIKAAYSHVIDTVRAELGDKSQKYLNTSAHATGNLKTGLYVSVMHDTNANTLTISARAGNTIGRMTTIATYDDQGRQSGFTDVDRWPGADELLDRIYAIVSDRLNPEPTEPDPAPEPAPKKARTSANRATSQKRDNQRAERDAQREAYRNAANEHVTDMAAILADAGFTVAEERDSGDTPVTIWHDTDGLATIKQTPYTVRIYNGRPARMGKKADAVFVNRVSCGWNPDYTYTPNGHAEGVAAFIAAHITYDEATDYAYIDTGEQSPAVDTPTGSTVATDTGAIIATGSHIDLCAFMPTLEELANGTAVYAHACKVCGQSTGSTATHYCQDHQPNAAGNRNPVEFDRSGPWEAAYQYPAISGGSHDHTPDDTTDARRIEQYEGKYKQMVRDGHADGTLDDADFTAAFAGCVRPLKPQYFDQLRRHIVAFPESWGILLEGFKRHQATEYGQERTRVTFDARAYTGARHDGKTMNEAIAAAYGETVLVPDR